MEWARQTISCSLIALLCLAAACGPAGQAGARQPTVNPTIDPTATAQPPPPPAMPTVVNGSGNSNAETAFARLQGEEPAGTLIVVDENSSGIEGDINRDLMRRHFRSTTGPDEGIDTHGLACYPRCLFVLRSAADLLSVDEWMNVLRHEYRHTTQALNNPQMASDFRDTSGRVTTYGAFSEACADDGLNVAPVYQSAERLGELRATSGHDQEPLIDRACSGDKSAYAKVVQLYNERRGSDNAFSTLFPPYD